MNAEGPLKRPEEDNDCLSVLAVLSVLEAERDNIQRGVADLGSPDQKNPHEGDQRDLLLAFWAGRKATLEEISGGLFPETLPKN